MRLTEQLVIVSHIYCAAKRRSISRVSTIIFNDGKKLASIEEGADLLTARFEVAMQWFSDRWPKEVAWPRSIPRPTPSATP